MSAKVEAVPLSAVRLARTLGVSPGSIRRWAMEADFPEAQALHQFGYQVVRAWNLKDVEAWLEKKRQDAIAKIGVQE